MIPKKLSIILLYLSCCLVISASSCGRKQSDIGLKYFDVRGFTYALAAALAEQPGTMIKSLVVNGKEDQQEITGVHDSIFWKNELQVFLEHDINKPVLRDAYRISKGTNEEGSQYENYQLIDSLQSGVTSMRVVYYSSGKVKSWKSEFNDQNMLYASQREVRMDFRSDQKGNYLEFYAIEGYHKLVLKDTVHYQILATLQY